MSDFKAQVYQIRFRLELRNRPRWGAYTAYPNSLARCPLNSREPYSLLSAFRSLHLGPSVLEFSSSLFSRIFFPNFDMSAVGGRTMVGSAALPRSHWREEPVGNPATHSVPDDDGRSAVWARAVGDRRAVSVTVRVARSSRLQVPLAVAGRSRCDAWIHRTDVPASQLHGYALGQASRNPQLLQLRTLLRGRSFSYQLSYSLSAKQET